MRVAVLALMLVSGPLLSDSYAWAAGRFGHVEFANSGASAAQADFLEGLAMLHDFEYGAAAAAFRRAQEIDPDFAMAYWGEAMTHNHPIWMQQDLEAGRAALNRLGSTTAARRARAGTEREAGYLDAIEILYGEGDKLDRDLRYEAAMKEMHERYPDDVNAAAFYGLSILGTAHAGRDISIYMKAAGVLEEAWMDHREHPGLVHYLIHSYDDPEHAPLGLRAARIYARIAPDAAHAQHMTSHIFLALGMWKESSEANVAAVAAEDKRRAADGKGPQCCGHYPRWLAYSYLQLGKTGEAARALATCHEAVESMGADDRPASPMHPDQSRVDSYAKMRLHYLIDTGDWDGPVAGWSLPKHAGPGARLDFALARAMREIARGRANDARKAIGKLEAIGHEVAGIVGQQAANPTYRLRPEISVLEVRGLMAEREGDLASAEQLFRKAAALEETLPIAFGPPIIDKPTHELLGEFLLRHGRRDEARAEFVKALARTPGRRLAEQGLAAATPSSE